MAARPLIAARRWACPLCWTYRQPKCLKVGDRLAAKYKIKLGRPHLKRGAAVPA